MWYALVQKDMSESGKAAAADATESSGVTDLEKAISLVLRDGRNPTAAARECGVPRQTLVDHLQGKGKEGAKEGHVPVLEQVRPGLEAELVEIAETWADAGHPLEPAQFCELLRDYYGEIETDIHDPRNSGQTLRCKFGRRWYNGFLHRHPQLSRLIPEQKKETSHDPLVVCRNLDEAWKLIDQARERRRIRRGRLGFMDQKSVPAQGGGVRTKTKHLARKGQRPKKVQEVTQPNVRISCHSCLWDDNTASAPWYLTKTKTITPRFRLVMTEHPDIRIIPTGTGKGGGMLTPAALMQILRDIVLDKKPTADDWILLVVDSWWAYWDPRVVLFCLQHFIEMIAFPGGLTKYAMCQDRNPHADMGANFRKQVSLHQDWHLSPPNRLRLHAGVYFKAMSHDNIASAIVKCGFGYYNRNEMEGVRIAILDQLRHQAEAEKATGLNIHHSDPRTSKFAEYIANYAPPDPDPTVRHVKLVPRAVFDHPAVLTDTATASFLSRLAWNTAEKKRVCVVVCQVCPF